MRRTYFVKSPHCYRHAQCVRLATLFGKRIRIPDNALSAAREFKSRKVRTRHRDRWRTSDPTRFLCGCGSVDLGTSMKTPFAVETDGDDAALPIERTVELSGNVPPSVVERYYERRYAAGVNGKPNQDYSVLIHSNNLCVLSLAPTHELMGETIDRIDFQVTESTHRLSNAMTGKGKRGAQVVQAGSTLCKVFCGGEEHKIVSAVPGKLVEMNRKLASDPNLMLTRPDDVGFIAIVIPQKHRFEQIKGGLLTEEQYATKSAG